MFDALTQYGITRRAAEQGKFVLQTWNPRDFTTDNYRTIDDRRAADLVGCATDVDAIELGGPADTITAGDYHTCALLDDGSVRCWGYNGRTPGPTRWPHAA